MKTLNFWSFETHGFAIHSFQRKMSKKARKCLEQIHCPGSILSRQRVPRSLDCRINKTIGCKFFWKSLLCIFYQVVKCLCYHLRSSPFDACDRACTRQYTRRAHATSFIVWDIGMKKVKERSKTSNWMVDHFSLTFVNLSLAWMFYLLVWLQNKGENSKFGVNTIISLAYIKRSRVSLLEPWQNNVSNPEAYSEPCRTFKMECFAKIVNG